MTKLYDGTKIKLYVQGDIIVTAVISERKNLQQTTRVMFGIQNGDKRGINVVRYLYKDELMDLDNIVERVIRSEVDIYENENYGKS